MRKDSWKSEEDELLAEKVFAYIKEGKSQIEAFEEVGNILKRTKGAVAFRWNNKLRKSFTKELKKITPKSKNKKVSDSPVLQPNKRREVILREKKAKVAAPKKVELDDVISFLQEFKDEKAKIVSLESELSTTLDEKNMIHEQYLSLYEDYTVLMNFVEKLKGMEKKELIVSK